MKCEQRRDLILLDSIGALDSTTHEEVRAHLATGCATCAGYLAEAEETVAHLPYLLPPVEPPERVKNKLIAQIREQCSTVHRAQDLLGHRMTESHKPTGYRAPLRVMAWSAVGGAAVMAATVFLLLSWPIRVQREQLARFRAQGAAHELRIRHLTSRVRSANQAISLLQSPHLQVISLTGSPAQPNASGYFLLDKRRRQCHCFVFNAATAKPGRTYQIWLAADNDQNISGGVISIDAEGSGAKIFDLPAGVDSIIGATITDELAPEASAASGEVQLTGTVE